MINTFISNDCVGARIYQILKKEFNNPFIWSRITYYDFLFLINHYDDNYIDFKNVKIQSGTTNVINIDDKIKPYYRHYVYNSLYKVPTQLKNKSSLDVYYYKIEEYCLQKYKNRLKRFLKNKSKPIFILNQKQTLSELGYGITDDNCLNFLKLKTQYVKILITQNKKFLSKNYKNTYIVLKTSENTCDIAKQVLHIINSNNILEK